MFLIRTKNDSPEETKKEIASEVGRNIKKKQCFRENDQLYPGNRARQRLRNYDCIW